MQKIMLFLFVLFFARIDALGSQDHRNWGSYPQNQRRLIRHLTDPKHYDRRVRPVLHDDQPINVTIRMNLYQIVDVVERQQYVSLYMWHTNMWTDVTLAWDPSKFGNITMVVLPYTSICLAMVREDSERWINTILQMRSNDSESAFVTFRYPALYKFTCHINVKHFPFDKQYCTMIFGSWTYDSKGIDFYPEREDIAKEDFSESEEWTLISFKAYRKLEKYACCDHPFSLLQLRLVIQRKPLHYIVNLIIPTVIISLISNVGFFTPTTNSGERSEKVNLGITTLLAFAILLLMVSDQMPTTSTSVPLIGWFLLGIMIQTSLATLATSVIMAIHRRSADGNRLSESIRLTFFNRIAPIVHVSAPPLLKKHRISEPDSPALRNAIVRIDHDAVIRCRSLPLIEDQTCIHFNGAPFSARSKETNTLELIVAEYDWFTSILDRIFLIGSLVSVIALAIGVSAAGYAKTG